MHTHCRRCKKRGLVNIKICCGKSGSKCVKGVCAGDCCPCAKAGLMLHTKACVWVRGSWLLNVLYSRGRRGAFRRGGARFPIQSPFVIESSHLHELSSRENVLGMCMYSTCTHMCMRILFPLSVVPVWTEVLHKQVMSRSKYALSLSLCKVYIVFETWKSFLQSRAHAITFQSQVLHGLNPSTLIIL